LTPDRIAELIAARARDNRGSGRFLVGIAGPPGSGKSTLAAALEARLSQAAAVPMDGFHLDDAILEARGQRARKGAPYTFDCRGFRLLLERLKSGEAEVFCPVFDRSLELSRNAAREVSAQVRIVIAEGNYLLLDEPGWRDVGHLLDFTVFLKPSLAELERRLMARWAHFGKTPEESRAWIDTNDMPNIRAVLDKSLPADVEIA
jgi:pantothenate kinase